MLQEFFFPELVALPGGIAPPERPLPSPAAPRFHKEWTKRRETRPSARGSSSHVKLNFKKYRLFVRLKCYHLKNIEQTDVAKSQRR